MSELQRMPSQTEILADLAKPGGLFSRTEPPPPRAPRRGTAGRGTTQPAASVVPEEAESRLPLLDIDALFSLKHDPADVLLGDGLLCAGELGLIVGPPDVGKTRLVTQLIFDLLFGRDAWLDKIALNRRHARILFLQTENSTRRLVHDFANQLRGCSAADRQQVKDRFKFSDPTFEPTPGNVAKACAGFMPDVLFLDPLMDFLSLKDENSAAEMRIAVKGLLRAAQAKNAKTVVLGIHHAKTGKAATAGAADWDAGAYARGSKALASIARAQINIAPGAPDGSAAVIICGKANNVKKFQPFAVRLEEDGRYFHDQEFSMEGWKKEVSDARGTARSSKQDAGAILRGVLKPGEHIPRSKAVKLIETAFGLAKTRAYEVVRECLAEGIAHECMGVIKLDKENKS